MKVASTLPSLLVMSSLLGCGDSFRPEDLPGSYGMAAIEGRSPPFLELASTECDQWIVDGALELRSEAAYILGLVIEVDCRRGGGEVVQQDRIYGGSFSIDEDRLEFTWHPPAGGIGTFQGEYEGQLSMLHYRQRR